jgi:hypothetical protein
VKKPNIFATLIVLIPALAAGLLSLGSPVTIASAEGGPYRCGDSGLYFPASGIVGWKHQDPSGMDSDPRGNRTLHTGVDIFAEGEGAPIYAPADGYVSRGPGAESVNIVLPGVANVLTGVAGIEMYFSHLQHELVVNLTFKAGEVIALQLGDHLHYSVGAFIGYDDREILQTQDPSPYFAASLSFNPESIDRYEMTHWCVETPRLADSFVSATTPATTTTPVEVKIARQDCLPDGRVAIVLPQNATRAGDWVDLSIFNNNFASDFLAMRATSTTFRWEGLAPGSPHFLRVNHPNAGTWEASPTVLFLTRTDCLAQ